MFVRVFENPVSPHASRSRGYEQRSYEIHPLEGGRYQLKIWGRLPRCWADHLCRGLARNGLGIVQGFARHGAEAEWIGSFELERTRRGVDPMLVDFLALALRPPSDVAPPPIAIEHYTIEVAADGALDLELIGPDQLGFLGGLLERLSFLSLVPDEMKVETGPGGIHDRFRLRMRDGGAPGVATARILAEILDGRLCTGVAAAG